MVTVRVIGDRVVIDLKRKRSKHAKMLRQASCFQSEWLQPEVAAAVTKWANKDGAAHPPFASHRVETKHVVDSSPPGTSRLQPFRTSNPELVIYEDRITLCGADVWRECTQLYTRDALALLSRKDKNGYVRIKGTKLTKDLGCPASNQIGAHFSRFCHRATEVMHDKGLDCGRNDIIQNFAGGYHFREWMKVRVIGTWAATLGVEPVSESSVELAGVCCKTVECAGLPLNQRQQWIISQVDNGAQLTMSDIVKHFRSECDRSTVGRDLRVLRELGVLETHINGYYVRSQK